MNFNANRNFTHKSNIQKPQNTHYVFKRLWDYLFAFKWQLFLAIALSMFSNLFILVGPFLTGKAIDAIDLETGVDFEKVFLYIMLMVVFYVFSSFFSYILTKIMIKLSKNIIYKMRKDGFDKLSSLPISYFDTNQIGDIISKFSYDIDTINTSLSNDVISICTLIITIIGSLTMMIIISPILVLVFVVTIPISLLFTRYMLKKTRPLFKKRSSSLGELNGYIEEMISGNKSIKAYGKEKETIDKFDIQNVKATSAAYQAEYNGSMTGPGVNFINNLSLSLICILGSLLYMYQGLSLGNISSFVLYSRKFSGPINEIANIFTDLQSALAASERVFSLIDAKEEKADNEDAIDLKDISGSVEMQGVTFGYTEDKIIINDLSFKAEPGKVIAIVGPTGGGKTTIVNLLMRFYDINSGVITLDEHNIYSLTRNSLRKAYAMVLQDTWLFQGTIYENLTYGNDKVAYSDVVNACKSARIHNYISKLPNGYDTVLTEGGINISKGQKQLLTIARAMLLDATMLIMDEATSNVDTRTEKNIQEAMRELMKDKTCFIIAHRLSTIQNADLILVLKDGRIIEQGTHQELLEQHGFYSDLFNAQYM